MASSPCTSCGLIHQGQCHLQDTTTGPDEPLDVTPAYCCTCYFTTIVFFFLFVLIGTGLDSLGGKDSCYLELFANSVSVSNANISTADWSIGFVARSPATGCKISLRTLNSRLLRGKEVISSPSSPSSDYFGQYVAGDIANVVFEKVVMPGVIDDVIWNFRVEIMSRVKIDVDKRTGFMMAACPDIPVTFTTDPTGNVRGSLLGNMRRCDYLFRFNYDPSDNLFSSRRS